MHSLTLFYKAIAKIINKFGHFVMQQI